MFLFLFDQFVLNENRRNEKVSKSRFFEKKPFAAFFQNGRLLKFQLLVIRDLKPNFKFFSRNDQTNKNQPNGRALSMPAVIWRFVVLIPVRQT